MNEWNDRNIKAIKALFEECTFLPSSHNKRFVRNLYYMRIAGDPMTDKQLANLWRLVWRYRRQVSDQKLIDLAAAGRGLEALMIWARGAQPPSPGSFVEYRPSNSAQRRGELEKLKRWNAG